MPRRRPLQRARRHTRYVPALLRVQCSVDACRHGCMRRDPPSFSRTSLRRGPLAVDDSKQKQSAQGALSCQTCSLHTTLLAARSLSPLVASTPPVVSSSPFFSPLPVGDASHSRHRDAQPLHRARNLPARWAERMRAYLSDRCLATCLGAHSGRASRCRKPAELISNASDALEKRRYKARRSTERFSLPYSLRTLITGIM